MTELKWGVLGLSNHFKLRIAAPLSRNEKNRFTALASRHISRAKSAAMTFGYPKAYGSYQELLEDKEIQAVYIPLPNNCHLEWIKKAAKAGKHILCEKPLTLNSEETRKAFQIAEENGVYLMEAFMFQFHPLWLKVKELIAIGEIGKLRGVHTFFTYNNTNPENIRNKLELGGGAIRDIGCYGIASTNFITPTLPKRIMSTVLTDPDFGTDKLSSFTLDYGDFQAMCTVSTQTWSSQSVKILGTGGIIEIPIPFNIFPDVPAEILIKNGVGERVISTGPADVYACQFDTFAQAVESKDDHFFKVRKKFSIENQIIMDTIFKSASENGWVLPHFNS
ncbi:MAG: Gfo/Idh/MocA family oxidoreductase [Spirochaetales bacterium]|nr:Gfo/Idh/MocA family oxidoreductase [Spirochaetales bacterium]